MMTLYDLLYYSLYYYVNRVQPVILLRSNIKWNGFQVIKSFIQLTGNLHHDPCYWRYIKAPIGMGELPQVGSSINLLPFWKVFLKPANAIQNPEDSSEVLPQKYHSYIFNFLATTLEKYSFIKKAVNLFVFFTFIK